MLLYFSISLGYGSSPADGLPNEVKSKQDSTRKADNPKEEKVFIIHAPIQDLDEFRQLAQMAMRLKPYGKVQINISTLAEKGFYEIPEGGSPWHEYACYNPTPYKFFPDEKLVPFVPENFVTHNRTLLLEKAKILREYGLEAAFFGYEPNFLPSAFFDAYPHMRGPRVDHPRRSRQEAFAPCISVPATQEMYAHMLAQLLKNVPEIKSLYFKTNDAGSGICWSDWQYSGPNGPAHCKNMSMGERVEMLMHAFNQGAAQAGQDITIYLSGTSSMFSDEEKKDIEAHLPANCHFHGYHSPEITDINSMIAGVYPVRGMFNALDILKEAQAVNDEGVHTVFINFRASYDRGYERLETADQVFYLLERQLENPTPRGLIPTLQALHQLCEHWAGEQSADRLFEAFVALDEAFQYKSAALPGVSTLYWGTTARHITRPLVIAPHRLTATEEAYFLPYVFNVSTREARMDYTDIHGAHRTVPSGTVSNFVSRLQQVSRKLESINAPAEEGEFIHNLATSLRIYASLMRSSGNFAEAQEIRERHSEQLDGPVHLPDKEPIWSGDPDLLKFNEIMRDELDNTQELIDILERRGLDLICHATNPAYEDMFVLGPDLIAQLKQKRKIMLDHWLDIEGYMTTPFK